MARKAGKQAWNSFPHTNPAYSYDGAKLKKSWAALHKGDQEPWPDARYLQKRFETHPELMAETADFGGDFERLANTLQDAWRAYHRGDFQAAFEAAEPLGPIAACIANKAQGIYAVYLMDDDEAQLQTFDAIARRAEAAAEVMPDDANAHYFRAFALGRYSQGISVTKALAQGMGGKIRESLDATLKLAPDHAEAHTAMGLYHAEIIDKVGSMIGGLTYGAKTSKGESHFATALKLTPEAPIAWIEYGNGLLMMYGDKKEEEATDAYVKASEMEAIDAMQALDVAFAQDQLE